MQPRLLTDVPGPTLRNAMQSREQQAVRARAKGKSMKRPGMPGLDTSPGSPGGGGGEAGQEGAGSEGRDDTALWEEATAMLRGELIRLGQEAAQKMEVGQGRPWVGPVLWIMSAEQHAASVDTPGNPGPVTDAQAGESWARACRRMRASWLLPLVALRRLPRPPPAPSAGE